MSRIGRLPITVPAGVTVTVDSDNLVTVKGPKGTLTYAFHPDMILKVEGNVLTVERPDEEHLHKSLHGLTRTLINNMVEGVEKGYSKVLEVNGDVAVVQLFESSAGINLRDSNLTMRILARDNLDIGSKYGSLETINIRKEIKVNE